MNNNIKHKFLLIFALASFFCNAQTAHFPVSDSLAGDLRVHDPVMIKQHDTYFIFSTGKGISIKRSEDKINWKKAGSVFDTTALPAWHKNDIPEQDGHLWAPDIHYRDGLYHLYYSVSAWMNYKSSIGYATNTTLDPDDPDYEWIDKGQVISFKNGGEGVNVIDPNVFVGKDEKVWLLYGSYTTGLRMAELNSETGHLKQDPPEITTLTKALGEGVYIIKGPEYYYIFASRGKCCSGLESNYQIVMGRSENFEGPYLNKEGKSWIDNNYTVFLAGNYEEPGRGHNGFYAENNITYIVYHAYTRSADGASLLNIKPLYVTEDGWPNYNPTNELFQMEKFQKEVFVGE